MRKILLLIICASASLNAQPGSSLNELTAGAEIRIHFADDTFSDRVTFLNSDTESIAYRSAEGRERRGRNTVWRIKSGDTYYSDFPMSVADHAAYDDYVSYIEAKGDVIVKKDGETFCGRIIGDNGQTMSIRVRMAVYEIARENIAVWRKDGTPHGDVDGSMTKTRSFYSLRAHNDRGRLLEFGIGVMGPWNILPQGALMLASNVNRPVFFGVRASLGNIGIQNTGLLYQASAFVNLNVYNFSTSRLFVGTSILWRSGGTYDGSYGDKPDSQISVKLRELAVTAHTGLKYKNLLIEIGAEIPLQYETLYTSPQATSVSDQTHIDLIKDSLMSEMRTVLAISRVHLAFTYLF